MNKYPTFLQIISIYLVLSILTACGKGFSDNVIIVPPSPIVTTDIQNLVADENAYRASLGQAPLTNGLTCTLYTFTSGDRIQATISGHTTLTGLSQVASFLYVGKFNQPNTNINQMMNILPRALQPLYTNLYLLHCTGQIVVTSDAYYSYALTSDDGSVLYVDGVKVVDNDNAHGAVTVTGMKGLRRGVHTFRLDYSQSAAGNQALILTSSGVLVDSSVLYH